MQSAEPPKTNPRHAVGEMASASAAKSCAPAILLSMNAEKTRPCGMCPTARASREGVHMKTNTYRAVSYMALTRPRHRSVRDAATARQERRREAEALLPRSPYLSSHVHWQLQPQPWGLEVGRGVGE